MKLTLKYLTTRTNKQGNVYAYIRKRGFPFVSIRDVNGKPLAPSNSPEFMDAYFRAIRQLENCKNEGSVSYVKPGSIAMAIREYKKSPKFVSLKPETKTSYNRILDKINDTWGKLDITDITSAAVAGYQDKVGKTSPRMADVYVQLIRNVFTLCIRKGWAQTNPATDIKPQHKKKPHETWTNEEVQQAIRDCPERLGRVYKWLWRTGLRLSDCLSIERRMIEGNVLHIVESKTKTPLQIPLHSDLIEDLNTGPARLHHLFVSTKGGPWTRDGFKTVSDKALKKVFGEKKKPLHGIRKTAISGLVEAGCSHEEVAAITGQSKQMVEHYAKEHDRAELAKRAMRKLEKKDNV